MTARGRLVATTAALVVVATFVGVTDVGAAETTKPVRVVRRFLAAYGAYDAKGALKYLAEEGIATGSGITGLSWGTPQEFRREVAMAKAQRQKHAVTGCEQQGESSDGVAVQCAFDHHEFRSDEVGLGPYTGNYWDLVVQDGKITSAVSTRAFITNGSSAERWEPFQRWVTSAYPEDASVMYGMELGITKEAIRLWERHVREFAAAEKAGTA
jgi:ketosteroid isomerase-like protein